MSTSTTITPIGDKVLLLPQKKEDLQTESGIFIPDSAKEKPQIATVVAVGNGRILENGEYFPLAVSVGDKVLFSRYAGTEIQLDKNSDIYLLVTERDILGIINKKGGKAE